MILSLRTWLALGLVLALSVPLALGSAVWLAAGEWQAQRELARRGEAIALLGRSALDSPGLAAQLSALGVEAEIGPWKNAAGVDETLLKQAKLAGKPPLLSTPRLQQGGDFKRSLERNYTAVSVDGGTVWVRHESAAVRWAVSTAAAALGLAAALALAVWLLQRWVLRPLARLAADADRIAGGELVVAPVATRAREVAQVGDALRGMTGALSTALGASSAAERERRFLVSAIAHDLRTPLFTLRGSLEAIEHGIGDGTALARAQRKADHLDRLVGDLFVFARSEYTREAYRGEQIDVREIARGVAETVAAGPVRLAFEADEQVPLYGDAVAVERALTNVLDNAVRHARSRVTVAVRARSPGAEIVVLDDGPGFADADLPHVFEPLFRGDRARSGGGAGLGLAIARRLARAHGGDVAAGNAPGGGARVVVTLRGLTSPSVAR